MGDKDKGLRTLSLMAFLKGETKQINLRDISLEYAGAGEGDADLLTGVHGIKSRGALLHLGAAWKVRLKNECAQPLAAVMVDVSYSLDNVQAGKLITRQSVEENGWLHLDQLRADYREKIKTQWLEWADGDGVEEDMDALSKGELIYLALKYPCYVRRMMQEDPTVIVAVHPVIPVIDANTVLMAASMRYQPERIVSATAKHVPEIEVRV